MNRGQAWNHALALAEAGVEDALAQLNRSFGTNNSRGGINGWSGSVSGPASLATPRALSGGTYAVTISAGLPIITSTGRVVIANSSQNVERAVRVRCAVKPAFEAAIVAKRDIVFSGNKIEVDSYDSNDPTHSTTNGLYNKATRKAGGDVASTEGFINVGNAEVKGKLYTGPINAGQYSVGPSGSVGDLNWNGPGIQTGWPGHAAKVPSPAPRIERAASDGPDHASPTGPCRSGRGRSGCDPARHRGPAPRPRRRG